MLRRMYAVLTADEPEAPTHYWPFDTILLSRLEIQRMAASVDMTLVDVVRPNTVPWEER